MIDPKGLAKDVAKKAVQKVRTAMGSVAPEVSNRYEAGSRARRLTGWRTSNNSVNAETRKSLEIIRRRSRDLVANHWAASRAKSVIQKNVVGSGIRPSSQNEQMERLLSEICNNTTLDPKRRKTLYSIQSLAMGAIPESGEVIVVRQRRTAAEMKRLGLSIPLQINVLESDHIDTLMDGIFHENGNRIYQGIEVDSTGAVVAYHLHPQHPGDTFRFTRRETTRVEARDVIHSFDEWRPGQMRGLPWGISAMIKMRDLSDYEDAQLQKQKIANGFAAFVHHNDQSPLEQLYDPQGVPQFIQPGTVEYLRPGEDVTFSNPPSVDGMAEFSQISTRAIAAAYNVTYESLTNDYSNVNFSSGRMGWLEMQRHITCWQREIMIAQICLRLEEWIREAAELVGINDDSPPWKWTPPRREMIDPVKETNAMASLVRNGFDSRDDVIQQMGRNPEVVDQEIAEGNDRIDRLGIVLDSDPRNMSQAGQEQPSTTNEEKQNGN